MKHLNNGESVRSMKLSDEEMALIKTLSLLTAKPVLFVANVIEGGFANNPCSTA